MVNDGNCNDETNNEDCLFDGDDYCGSCPNTELCTQCACLGNLSGNGYSNPLLGNAICNENFECAFDAVPMLSLIIAQTVLVMVSKYL